MIVFLYAAIFIFPILGYFVYRNIRRNVKTKKGILEYVLIASTGISTVLFAFGWMFHSDDYYTAIDIVDGGYTPFASAHLLTLVVFFTLSIWSIFALWLKGDQLPPILFVLAVIFLSFGGVICIGVLLQLGNNAEQSDAGILMSLLPICYLIISISLFVKIAAQAQHVATDKSYKNKILNYLNTALIKTEYLSLWVIILFIPVVMVVVAVLMLFGQEYDSITKVLTDTTTWSFSEKSHPPFLDHKGHYLCTVAVCGDPNVVKPLRLGKRHDHEIVVNRQLLVANAFEQLIEESAPRLHKLIRSAYDKYGYALSRKITTPASSNLVYRLMKPLEYFFLITLYAFCVKPEEKINKQYEI